MSATAGESGQDCRRRPLTRRPRLRWLALPSRLGRGRVTRFALGALGRDDIVELLRQNEKLKTYAADVTFVDRLLRVSGGDPLHCNLLIKALRDGALTPEELEKRPSGLEAFLRDWVETLRRQSDRSAGIRELLALCAIAWGPLAVDDLRALAPDVFAGQAQIIDAARHDTIARFIITVGNHRYVFSHQRLREVFLEEIYSLQEQKELHRRLVEYGKRQYEQGNLTDYLRQFWLLHVAALEEWRLLEEVVSAITLTDGGQRWTQRWQALRYAAEGSDSGYLSDLERLWQRAEATNDLALMLRCALIAASLRSRSGNLPPELLVALVQTGTPAGRWSAAAALEHIAHVPDERRQSASLTALVEAGVELPWERVLDVARGLGMSGHGQRR
ncbi:MAG: hypothetical protein ACUVSW_08500 [Roseiflexus sp.]